jgi:hypothetical protein
VTPVKEIKRFDIVQLPNDVCLFRVLNINNSSYPTDPEPDDEPNYLHLEYQQSKLRRRVDVAYKRYYEWPSGIPGYIPYFPVTKYKL